MKKTFLVSVIATTLFFSMGGMLVSAQRPDVPPTGGGSNNPAPAPTNGNLIKFDNPFKVGDTLHGLVENIINNLVLPIGGVLAVLAFIYSGFMYVMAQGNETKLKTANKALMYTAIGTAVLLGAWVFANVIKSTVDQLIV